MSKLKGKKHPIDVVDKPKERADRLRAGLLADAKHARSLAKALDVLEHPTRSGSRGSFAMPIKRDARLNPGRYDSAKPRLTGAFVTSLDILEDAGLPRPGWKGNVAKVIKNPDGTLTLVEKGCGPVVREMERSLAALRRNARMQKACIVTDEDRAPKKS